MNFLAVSRQIKIKVIQIIKSQTFVTFIKVLAIALTLLSGYFLIKSTLSLSPSDILQTLKAEYFSIEKGGAILAQQKADIQIGFILLLVSFFLQMVHLFIPGTWDNMDINKFGVCISMTVFIIIFILSLRLNKWLSTKTLQEINRIYIQEQIK